MIYINKKLRIENINLENIAQKYGTPAYCYSYNQLKDNISRFKRNFASFSPIICFAVKSNTNLSLLKEIKKFGLGADVVSQGELMMAIKAGIDPKKIVFSGVGKSTDEIKYAIDKKILLINAESMSEVKEIDKIAKSKNIKVMIGLRLNPNTDANTLSQISTGKKGNKFGVNQKTFNELVKYCKNSKNLDLQCLSVHIGSQILSHRPYEKMLNVIDKTISKIDYKFKFIDLGGGMGISYTKKNKLLNYRKYSIAIKKFLKRHNSKIIFEPGRSIIGNVGTLISKIIYIKKNENKNFIILDAGMNDLIRPALYNAFHEIIPTKRSKYKILKKHDFVGPICETTDKFLSLSSFQKLTENDNLVICDVGAYGKVLSSNYNLRLDPAEILIKNREIFEIKKRGRYKDII